MSRHKSKSIVGQLRTVRLTLYLWNYKITPQGRFLVFGFLLSAAIGSTSVDMALYLLFCALSALFLVALLVGFILRPRVKIDGQLTPKTITGYITEWNFTIKNLSRLPAFNVSLGFFGLPGSIKEIVETKMVIDLKPGETRSITIQLQAMKRGVYSMPKIKPYSTFPFNIFRSGSKGVPVRSLMVLPDFQPVAHIDIPASKSYQPGGIILTSQIGESLEYIGNRDYLPGDSFRNIDFRSWARLAKPITKEYHEEYYCRVALVLDTYVLPGAKRTTGGYPELEAAISLCATVADVLSRTEYIIDIFAVGPELYVYRAGRNMAHFDNVLEILACLDACRKNPFETLTPAIVDELANISYVVFVFTIWDETRKKLVQNAAEAGCKIKILMVSKDDRDQSIVDLEEWVDSVSLYTVDTIKNGRFEFV